MHTGTKCGCQRLLMTHVPLLDSLMGCSGISDAMLILSCRRFAGHVDLLILGQSACLTGERDPGTSGPEEALSFHLPHTSKQKKAPSSWGLLQSCGAIVLRLLSCFTLWTEGYPIRTGERVQQGPGWHQGWGYTCGCNYNMIAKNLLIHTVPIPCSWSNSTMVKVKLIRLTRCGSIENVSLTELSESTGNR